MNRKRPTPHSRRRVTARGPPMPQLPRTGPRMSTAKTFETNCTKEERRERRRRKRVDPLSPGENTRRALSEHTLKKSKKRTGSGRSRHTPSPDTPLASAGNADAAKAKFKKRIQNEITKRSKRTRNQNEGPTITSVATARTFTAARTPRAARQTRPASGGAPRWRSRRRWRRSRAPRRAWPAHRTCRRGTRRRRG